MKNKISTNFKYNDPLRILLDFPPYKYITKTLWVKEKPKFFNNKTCLITHLKYSVLLFYNLFMHM